MLALSPAGPSFFFGKWMAAGGDFMTSLCEFASPFQYLVISTQRLNSFAGSHQAFAIITTPLLLVSLTCLVCQSRSRCCRKTVDVTHPAAAVAAPTVTPKELEEPAEVSKPKKKWSEGLVKSWAATWGLRPGRAARKARRSRAAKKEEMEMQERTKASEKSAADTAAEVQDRVEVEVARILAIREREAADEEVRRGQQHQHRVDLHHPPEGGSVESNDPRVRDERLGLGVWPANQ
jgi:hypothetical protein